MTNPKGTRAETAVVEYLKRRGWRYAERRAKNGRKDRGDIAGLPGVVIEVKSAARVDLSGWVREARIEALNDNAAVWLVCAKAPGKGLGRVEEWYAITSMRVMVDLLADDSGVALERDHFLNALRHYMATYTTCPCGAWVDRLDKRPHAPGCPVDRALSLLADGVEPAGEAAG